MPKGIPTVSKVDALADIDRAIAELQDRRKAEVENEKVRDELRKFLAARPFLNRVEVMRIAKAMPVVGKVKRGKPVKSRHADRATGNAGPRSTAHAAIGKAIATAREAKDMTTETLAHKLDVSSSAVYAWENGRWAPSRDLAPKLAKLLAVPVDRLKLPAKANGHAPA